MNREAKTGGLLLLLVLPIAVIAWCARCVKRVYSLRPEDAVSVRVHEMRPSVLLISGAIFHSGLSIDQVTTENRGDRIVIRVYLRGGGANGRSDFRLRLNLPKGISAVQLGDTPPYVTVAKACGYSLRLPLRVGGDRRPRLIWQRGLP